MHPPVPTAVYAAGDFSENAAEAMVRDDRGIEIPFPQRTIWIRTEPEAMAAAIPVTQVGAGGNGR